MDKDKRISIAVIKRLPRYYRYLGGLLESEITKISSTELSKLMNVTASQIRQDLNNFGCFGLQGYGYNVELLHKEIGKILGINEPHSIIIIGVGSIGRALARYNNFEKRGFKVVGLFDKNPDLIGQEIGNVVIRDISELTMFAAENEVDIAALTLPQERAESVANVLARTNIMGIWNFSNIDLHDVKGKIIENVHLTDSLMTLSYRLQNERKDI